MSDTRALREEFYVISTESSTYIVTEEVAFGVLQRCRNADEPMIEVENLAGNRTWIKRETIDSIEESTPEVRDWHYRHNLAMRAEKKAAGFFEGDDG